MDNKAYSLYCSSLQTNVHDSESTWLKVLKTAEWHSMLSTRKLNSPLGSASIHCASSARFSKGSILRVNRLSETCRDAPFREDNQPTGPLTADQPGLDVYEKNRQLHQQDTSYPLGFKQTEAAEALQGNAISTSNGLELMPKPVHPTDAHRGNKHPGVQPCTTHSCQSKHAAYAFSPDSSTISISSPPSLEALTCSSCSCERMVGSMNGVSRIAMHDSSASDVRPKAEAPLLGIDPTIVANKEQHTPAAVPPATMPADGPNLQEFAADEAPAKKAPAAGGGDAQPEPLDVLVRSTRQPRSARKGKDIATTAFAGIPSPDAIRAPPASAKTATKKHAAGTGFAEGPKAAQKKGSNKRTQKAKQGQKQRIEAAVTEAAAETAAESEVGAGAAEPAASEVAEQAPLAATSLGNTAIKAKSIGATEDSSLSMPSASAGQNRGLVMTTAAAAGTATSRAVRAKSLPTSAAGGAGVGTPQESFDEQAGTQIHVTAGYQQTAAFDLADAMPSGSKPDQSSNIVPFSVGKVSEATQPAGMHIQEGPDSDLVPEAITCKKAAAAAPTPAAAASQGLPAIPDAAVADAAPPPAATPAACTEASHATAPAGPPAVIPQHPETPSSDTVRVDHTVPQQQRWATPRSPPPGHALSHPIGHMAADADTGKLRSQVHNLTSTLDKLSVDSSLLLAGHGSVSHAFSMNIGTSEGMQTAAASASAVHGGSQDLSAGLVGLAARMSSVAAVQALMWQYNVTSKHPMPLSSPPTGIVEVEGAAETDPWIRWAHGVAPATGQLATSVLKNAVLHGLQDALWPQDRSSPTKPALLAAAAAGPAGGSGDLHRVLLSFLQMEQQQLSAAHRNGHADAGAAVYSSKVLGEQQQVVKALRQAMVPVWYKWHQYMRALVETGMDRDMLTQSCIAPLLPPVNPTQVASSTGSSTRGSDIGSFATSAGSAMGSSIGSMVNSRRHSPGNFALTGASPAKSMAAHPAGPVTHPIQQRAANSTRSQDAAPAAQTNTWGMAVAWAQRLASESNKKQAQSALHPPPVIHSLRDVLLPSTLPQPPMTRQAHTGSAQSTPVQTQQSASVSHSHSWQQEMARDAFLSSGDTASYAAGTGLASVAHEQGVHAEQTVDNVMPWCEPEPNKAWLSAWCKRELMPLVTHRSTSQHSGVQESPRKALESSMDGASGSAPQSAVPGRGYVAAGAVMGGRDVQLSAAGSPSHASTRMHGKAVKASAERAVMDALDHHVLTSWGVALKPLPLAGHAHTPVAGAYAAMAVPGPSSSTAMPHATGHVTAQHTASGSHTHSTASAYLGKEAIAISRNQMPVLVRKLQLLVEQAAALYFTAQCAIASGNEQLRVRVSEAGAVYDPNLHKVVKALPAHGLDTPCVLLSTSPGIVSSLYRSHAGAAGAIGSPAGQHDPAAAALVSWQVPVKEEVWLLEPAAHPKATTPATSTANSVNGQEFLPGSAPLSAAAAAAAAAALPPTSAPGAAAGSGLLTFSNGASSALKSPDSLLLRGAAAGHAGPSAAGSAAALASAEEDGDYEDDYGLACDAATDPIRSKLGSASTVANSTVSGENAHSPSTSVKPYTKPHDSASKPDRVSEQGAERLGATQVREGDNVTGRQGSHGPSRAGTAMAKPENHSAVGGSRTAPSTVRPVFAMQAGSSAAALPAAISSRVGMCASSLAGGTAAPAAAAPVPAQKTTRQRSDSGEDKGGMAGGTYPLAERKRNEAKGVLQGMPLWVVWGAAALSVMAAEMVLSLQHAGL